MSNLVKFAVEVLVEYAVVEDSIESSIVVKFNDGSSILWDNLHSDNFSEVGITHEYNSDENISYVRFHNDMEYAIDYGEVNVRDINKVFEMVEAAW